MSKTIEEMFDEIYDAGLYAELQMQAPTLWYARISVRFAGLELVQYSFGPSGAEALANALAEHHAHH